MHASEAQPAAGLWRNRDFLLLWGGQTVSRLGSRVSDIALPLLVLALRGSPVQVGFILAVQSAPYLLLSLPAGALADRWNRKRVMIVCDLARFLAFGSIPLAVALGRLGIAQLYAVAAVAGVALAFFDVAEMASLPRVVPADQLARAASLNAATEAAAYLLGPGIGGALIALGRSIVSGAGLAYLIDSLSYLVSVLSLGFMRLPTTANASEPRAKLSTRALYAEIADGVRFLWANTRLRAICLLAMSVSLCEGPLVIAIIFLAKKDLHANSLTIGLILSLAAVGELIGSFAASWFIEHLGIGVVIVGAVAVMALSIPLLAAASSMAMVAGGAALADMMIPIYNVTVTTLRLSLIPDALQARVNSAFSLPSNASGILGTAAGGVIIGLYGPRPLLWLIAIGLGLSAAVAGLTSLARA